MDTKRVVGGAVVLVTVVVLLSLVVGVGRTETEIDDAATFDPDDIGERPLVVERHESGGFEVFGITISGPDRWLIVGVAARPECLGQDDTGAEVLLGEAACEEYASLAGPVTGGGRTSAGVSWVAVRIDVDEDCFRTVEAGDRWPSIEPRCP